MIAKLQVSLPNHTITSINSPEYFIVDYKQLNGGIVVISSIDPQVPHIYIENSNNIGIYFDGFLDNALEITPGTYCKKCECVTFPQTCNEDDWILCVETKYVHNIENAFRESNDYPNSMIDQIIDTVNYFRAKEIIEYNRRVTAIVSFPTLIEDFSASFFTGTPTIEDILINHNIRIRATNSAQIISQKRIRI